MTLSEIPSDARDDVREFLFAVADDEFITSNRYSRWVGSGPTLEEDNTLSSFIQDELGHARAWLEVIAESDERTVTALAQTRPAAERRHTVLVEPDHAGFADTVARNFLYDYAEQQLVQALSESEYDEIASRADMVRNEEQFHRQHADQWLEILATTEEAHKRICAAIDKSLPRARDYFAFREELGEVLRDVGVIDAEFADLETAWIDNLTTVIERSPLEYEASKIRDTLTKTPETNGRAGEHTDTLNAILDNLYPTKEELYPDHIDLDADIRYDEKIGLE